MNFAEVPASQTPSPKVSVLGACYNHIKYIHTAVQSILSQKGVDFELIVIDDASQDASAEYLRTINDPRVRVIVHEKNQGVCRTYNELYNLARGEYLAFMPGDDISVPYKLALQAAFLDNHPNVAAVFSHMKPIDEHGNPVPDLTETLFNIPSVARHSILRLAFLGVNCLCAPSEMIRKSAIDREAVFYDPRFLQTQDLEQHVRLLLRDEFAILPKPLVQYRRHDANLSNPTPERYNRHNFEHFLMLDHFLEIKDVDLLLQILPECAGFGTPEEKTIPYFLARAGIASGGASLATWGLKVLSSLMADASCAELLEKRLNFTLKDYYELTGEAKQFCPPRERSKGAAPRQNEPSPTS